MCTAITYQTADHYFGRTLDYECSYGEEVVVTPRHFPLPFVQQPTVESHYAMIGMAHVRDGYPLYYDGVNEKGLGMAGLNFVGNAVYGKSEPGRNNVAQFEFIPWILGQCASVQDACRLLETVQLLDTPFRPDMPVAQLHWLIADACESVTVEAVAQGLRVYKNPVGVLTNNPPFDKQLFALNNYRSLTVREPENRFAPGLELERYSRGLGAMGLPGDLSSQSRFVRAVFTKLNSRSGKGEAESVSQFFHILGTVEQTRGCCVLEDDSCEITIYTSCCNAAKGIYYYTTYDNQQITAVDMHRCDLEGAELARYPLITQAQIYRQNG